jgi:arylsulfatase
LKHNPLSKRGDLPAETESETLFRRAIYNAQIDNLDENIGRLTDKLKAHGILDDTLILFMSDNGCSDEMGRLAMHFLAESYDHVDS